MASRLANKTWRICCGCMRGIRFGILVILLLVVTLVLYFNEVGLPNFIKRPLLAQLHERGIDLEFTRLRWNSYRGFVAENVTFGPARTNINTPEISLREVELKLNREALAHFKFQVERLILHDGKIAWPLVESGKPTTSLSVTNLETQLRFLTNDEWQLDNFSAAFAGARLRVTGSLTNASYIREWKVFHGHNEAPPELLRRDIRELANVIDKIKFSKAPEINMTVHGDARESRSLNGLVTLNAEDADTPWGTLTGGSLVMRLIPPQGTNNLSQVEFRLKADDVTTRWAETKQFQLELHAIGDDQLTNLVQARMTIHAREVVTPWAQAASASFSSHWTHSLTNPIPTAGSGELHLTDAHTRWGDVAEVRFDGMLGDPAVGPRPPPADASWGPFAALQPYFFDWNCTLTNIRTGDFTSDSVVCGGNWRGPVLSITNLHTEIYQGQLTANATLNAATRATTFGCALDFDVQKAKPFLTSGGRAWFEKQQFTWEKPPTARATGGIVLPDWTDKKPDWRNAVLPTLFLTGDFKVGAASYRGIPVTSAQSHFTYSNVMWYLPDLVATRPEGEVRIIHRSDDRTKDFYFQVHSTLDLKCLQPALDPRAGKVFEMFSIPQPPVVDAEIWGRWRDFSRLGAKARVSTGDIIFRNQTATSFHGNVIYTNQFIVLTDARLERGSNEVMTASSVGFDIVGKKGFLTNGFSTSEPTVLLQAIGPKVATLLEPYHFTQPPRVEGYGVIPLSSDISVADLHFKVDGGTFEWMKFRLPHVHALVHWAGEDMTIDNAEASFYGGKLTGNAAFDFRRKVGTDFKFDTIVTGASLHDLIVGITSNTNRLEGTLDGHLAITQANSHDLKSWFGKGDVSLQDGLIWDIPIFGVLSPVLDAVSPDLGHSRAKEGAATFIITNSVIRSDDLKISSPTVRLLYRGTVDFNMQVDAVVEAQVGHNTPIVGPLVTTVLTPFSKLFETKVTGTLSNPKREPVMLVTKLISPFLHPFQTLKDIFIGNTSAPTNGPAIWPVPQPGDKLPAPTNAPPKDQH